MLIGGATLVPQDNSGSTHSIYAMPRHRPSLSDRAARALAKFSEPGATHSETIIKIAAQLEAFLTAQTSKDDRQDDIKNA